MGNRKRIFAGSALVVVLVAAAGGLLVQQKSEDRRFWQEALPDAVSDTIRFTDGSGTPVDATAILAEGSFDNGTCRVYTGKSQYAVGNLTDETLLAVVSSSKGVYFDTHVKWSWWLREQRDIVLPDPVPMNVKVWQISDVSKTPRRDADNAKTRFEKEWTGIAMTYGVEDVATLRMKNANCDSITKLMSTVDPRDSSKVIFDPGAINVYYTDNCGKDCIKAGLSCEADPRFNFVYSIGTQSTMLHELGHALLGKQGIKHWTLAEGWSNVMRDSSAPIRQEFSTGQVITMSREASSAFQTIGVGSANLNCQQDCPKVEFDEAWSACRPSEVQLSPENAIDALFDCVECSEGQLERVVDESRTNPSIVPTLGNALALPPPRVGIEPAAPPLAPDPYDLNTTARRQRRSVKALERISLTNDPQAERARTFIRDASSLLGGYRADVRDAITESMLVIQ